MINVANISILRVFLTISLALISLVLSSQASSILAFSLILTVGLLHGSNDLLIIKKVAQLEYTDRWVFLKTITAYLFSIGIILLAFYANRAYALFFFVVISAFHFGQQHLAQLCTGSVMRKVMLYSAYGLGIFGMLFATHPMISAEVIAAISGYTLKTIHFQGLSVLAFILFFFTAAFHPSFNAKKMAFEVLQLLLLWGVFLITDLLLSFALYFAFWHAFPSLKDQIQLLYQQPFSRGIKSYVRSSYIYWLVSVLVFAILILFLDVRDVQVIELLVYFLAAVTFPHVIVMSRVESLLES